MIYKLGFLLAIIFTILAFGLDITDSGGSVKLIAEILIVLLFISALIKNVNHRIRNKGVIRIWIISLCMSPILLLVSPGGAESLAVSDIREFFIPFAITYSSFYLLDFSDKEFRVGLIIIGIVSVVIALYILNNTGGFDVLSFYREETNKNQTAPFFASVGLVSLAYGLSDGKKLNFIIFFGFIFLVCLIYCMILRARTSTIVMLSIATLILYKTYHLKLMIIIPVLLIVIGSQSINQISDFFSSSFIGHSNVSDLNDLTSGRTDRMEQSADFILSHPVIGAISNDRTSIEVWSGNFPIVHNYLMWKMVKYGLFFSLPFIITYFSILKNIYNLFLSSWKNYKYAIICILVAFITSLSEYSAPFGPGTSFILCYIIYGYSLRNFYQNKT